jgi:hypothetical protein
MKASPPSQLLTPSHSKSFGDPHASPTAKRQQNGPIGLGSIGVARHGFKRCPLNIAVTGDLPARPRRPNQTKAWKHSRQSLSGPHKPWDERSDQTAYSLTPNSEK